MQKLFLSIIDKLRSNNGKSKIALAISFFMCVSIIQLPVASYAEELGEQDVVEYCTISYPTDAGYEIVPSDGSFQVESGADFKFTVSIQKGYAGDNIVVKANDVELSAESGVYTITNVTEDKTITVSGVKILTYEVTWNTGDGYILSPVGGSEATTVEYGGSFRFTVDIVEGYDGKDLKVVVGDQNLTANADGIYTISNITENKYIEVSGVVLPDTTAPIGSITINEETWTVFSSNITFDTYVNKAQKVSITASDEGGVVAGRYYYISDGALSETQLDSLVSGSWKSVPDDGEFTIESEGKAVVYVKLIDDSDNKTYISSKGFVLDFTAPKIEGVDKDTSYYEEKIVTITDENLDKVTVNDKEVDLVDDQLTLPQTNEAAKIVATDKAGNKTELTVYVYETYSIELTTGEGYKIVPEDETTVKYNNSFRFKVLLDEGYGKSDFKVMANDELLTEENGVYTIRNITEDKRVTVSGVKDIAYPTGTITIGEYICKASPDPVEFNKYFSKNNNEINIQADDKGSGVKTIEYIMTETVYSDTSIMKVTDWKVLSGNSIIINKDSKFILYIKITDKGDNITYLHSDGLIFDFTAPEISGIENGATYNEDMTVEVVDKYLDKVSVNGEAQNLENNKFVLKVINGEAVVVATDKAGNTTEVKVKLYDTYKVTYPASGIYIVTPYNGSNPTVQYGDSFRFKVTVQEGYDASAIRVTVDDEELTPDSNGVYTLSDIKADKIIEVTGAEDTTAPTGTITIGTNTWRKFLNTITFDLFFKDTEKVTINANDEGIGVAEVYYHISDISMTEEEVKALTDWDLISNGDSFNLTPEEFAVVYAKLVDKAGNVGYISSNGMIFDYEAPVITGINNGESYYEEKTVEITDKYLESVTIDGNTQALDSNNQLTLKQTNKETVIVARDKAGNETRVAVTVYKTYTVTLPEGEGYTIVAEEGSASPVRYGESFSFTIKIAEGYTADDMVVKANASELKPSDGIYTIDYITNDIEVTVNNVKDSEAPRGSITLGDYTWNSYSTDVKFDKFFSTAQKVVITGEDNGSGVYDLYYYLSSKELSESELKRIRGWNTIASGESITIEPDNDVIVYVKLVDEWKNTEYINSTGIVVDGTKPSLTGIEDGKIYYNDTTVKVNDAHLKVVTVNGTEQSLDSNNSFILKTSDDKYTIKAVDECGNDTEMSVYVCVRPGKPAFSSVESIGFDSVELKWDKTSNTDGYLLYRADNYNDFKLIKDIVDSDTLTYLDEGLICGANYSYKIVAYRNIDDIRVKSEESSIKKIAPIPPTVNFKSAESSGYNSIKLTWEAINGSTGYRIYRSISEDFKDKETILINDPLATEYTDTNLTPGVRYYYYIQAFKETDADVSGLILGEPSVTRSAMPIIEKMTLFVTSGGYDSIRITWNSLNGADGYDIYMSETKDGEYKLIKEAESNEKSYTHKGLEIEKTYYFKAQAYTVLDEESGERLYGDFSDIKSTAPKLGTTTIYSAKSVSTTSIKLTWTAVEGADAYQVYRSTSKDSGFKLFVTVNKKEDNPTSYTITNIKLAIGETYYYKIRAYRRLDGETRSYGEYSSVVSVKTKPGTANITTAVSAGYNSIKLEWDEVKDADAYRIYMSTKSDSGFERIATIKKGVLTYTEKGLDTGKKYYFKIITWAYDANDNIVLGNYSSVKSATPKPAKVTISSATSSSYNNVTLKWNKVAGADAYQIYYSTKRDSGYKILKTISDGSLSYTYSKLTTGVKYYFKIRAYSRDKNEERVYGTFSTIKSVTPELNQVVIKSISSPSRGKITLNWSKVSGAHGYQIYRYDSSKKEYVRIKTITSGSTLTYSKTGHSSGKTYYYKIRAYRTVNDKKVYGSYSKVKYCKVR